jgi:hypothetical protein
MPAVDPHHPGIRKEQKRLIRAFGAVMSGSADMGVSQEHILQIRSLLAVYLEPVRPYLMVFETSSEQGPSEQ